MKRKIKYLLILIIFLIAFLSSLLLSQNVPCGSEETCSQVTAPIFQDKVTNGYIGMVIFAFLSVITYLQIRKPNKKRKLIINTGIVFGSMIALYLLYLQFFALHAYCTYCMIIDFGLLIALGIICIFEG
jgi:uncharacterized membrane protein